MTWLATGEQMRQADARAMAEYSLPGSLLMEAASVFTAQVARAMAQGNICIIAGGGNNAGDGWGAARHLAAMGSSVLVLSIPDPADLAGDAALQFRAASAAGVPWQQWQGRIPSSFCLLVDALLGTGSKGAPRGEYQKAIAAINSYPAKVLAVDIPSGLPTDTQRVQWEVVKAEATATFGLAKLGLYTPAGRRAAGQIHISPVGLPQELIRSTGQILNTAKCAARGLPNRRYDSHKGSYGHGLLVAGSRGMSGAAMLAASSALKSGIGLLTCACPRGINSVLEANLWEALTLPLAETVEGFIAGGGANQLEPFLAKFAAAAVGPGLGLSAHSRDVVDLLVASDLPLIIDADALNHLAPGIPKRQRATVVTPHPGEMARLLGNTIEAVVSDPLTVARDAARAWQCVVILKGCTSYVASPEGTVAVSITGTDGLATGGSGDVLSGLLLGLISQGAGPFAAACAATWLLGRASELAEPELGTASQLPRDILTYLPLAIKELGAIST